MNDLYDALNAAYAAQHYTLDGDAYSPHYRAFCPDNLRLPGDVVVCADSVLPAPMLVQRFANLRRSYPNYTPVLVGWRDSLLLADAVVLGEAGITVLPLERELEVSNV